MTKSHDAPCPSCGYCPTCGRKNAATTFPYPYYPVWVYPYQWGVSPNVTIGTGTWAPNTTHITYTGTTTPLAHSTAIGSF